MEKPVKLVPVTATRGVCVGVGKNLTRGQSAEINEDDANYLISTGQVIAGVVDLKSLKAA